MSIEIAVILRIGIHTAAVLDRLTEHRRFRKTLCRLYLAHHVDTAGQGANGIRRMFVRKITQDYGIGPAV